LQPPRSERLPSCHYPFASRLLCAREATCRALARSRSKRAGSGTSAPCGAWALPFSGSSAEGPIQQLLEERLPGLLLQYVVEGDRAIRLQSDLTFERVSDDRL